MGAKKLQSNCTFYEDLEGILGTRDAINAAHMTISSSNVISKKKSPSAGPVSKEGENSSSRIKKSGSTLITIGFVIRPKIDPIWPLGTMAGTMAATASKYSRDFSKFSD